MRKLLLLLLLFLIPVCSGATGTDWLDADYNKSGTDQTDFIGLWWLDFPSNLATAYNVNCTIENLEASSQSFVVRAVGSADSHSFTIGAGATEVFDLDVDGDSISSIEVLTTNANIDFNYTFVISYEADATYSESYDTYNVFLNATFDPEAGIDENSTGWFNSTFSIIDFSVNGYVGTPIVLLDSVDVSGDTSISDETVSLAVTNINNSSHTVNITVPYNKEPTLIAPADDSVHNYSYPPMTHLINLSSEDVCSYTRYKIWQGNVLKYSTTVAGNSTGVYLPSGDYMWSAESYSPELGTYSSYDTRNFTINDLLSHPVNATGVYGVIYEDLAGMDTAVESALVTVYNASWSDEMLTDEYGYYEFYNLTNGTYYISVTKDRYDTPATKYITLTTSNMSLMNIYIERNTGDYYARHDVEFIVKSLLGTRYENVEVTVYISGSSNIYDVDETDSAGKVVFPLEEDTEYYITFINATQGINDNIYLYPIKDIYNIYVTKDSIPTWTNTSLQDVAFVISTTEINATTANITVQYIDYMDNTTSGTIYLNQTNQSDLLNQTMLDSQAVTGNITFNFTVTDYSGESYLINAVIVHGDHGTVSRTYSVQFDGMVEDYGFSNIWKWIAVGGLVFAAGSFNSKNVKTGVFIVCGLGWVFVFMGFFDNFGSGSVTAVKAGLTLSTVLALMYNFGINRRVDA